MVRHIVFLKLIKDKTPEHLAKIKHELAILKDKIDVIKEWEVGVDESNDPFALDVVVISSFESRADLDYYFVHPEHMGILNYLADINSEKSFSDYVIDDSCPPRTRDDLSIRHIEIFKLMDNTREHCGIVQRKFTDLKNKIDFLKEYDAGINFVASPRAYDIIVVAQFKDEEELKAYKNHPNYKGVSHYVDYVGVKRRLIQYTL